MKYFPCVGIVILFILSGCSSAIITDTRNPDQLLERAKTLTARAAGARRTAQKYDVLMEKTQKDIAMRQKRLDSHLSRKKQLNARIRKLKQRKREMSDNEADKLEFTINNYVQEREAVEANIDENKIRIRKLKDRMQEQQSLKDNYLYKSRNLLKQAQEMRKRAAKLSGSKQSS